MKCLQGRGVCGWWVGGRRRRRRRRRRVNARSIYTNKSKGEESG